MSRDPREPVSTASLDRRLLSREALTPPFLCVGRGESLPRITRTRKAFGGESDVFLSRDLAFLSLSLFHETLYSRDFNTFGISFGV